MSEDLRSLVKEYHTFYEVSPYYVLVEERHGSASRTARSVQAGFDVEVYGVNTRNELAPPGSDPVYALGYSEVRKIAEEISHHKGDSCSLEVIPSRSTAVLDSRDHTRVEAMILIRISHLGDLEQPAGPPEQGALEEVENRLRALGIARR